MIKDEIENLREYLNEMVSKHDCDSKDILNVSRELDVLIVNYLNESELEK